MFALGIRFLCDWSMGKRTDSHERPEWPPHPDRVFMALAAAHFEMGVEPAQRALSNGWRLSGRRRWRHRGISNEQP